MAKVKEKIESRNVLLDWLLDGKDIPGNIKLKERKTPLVDTLNLKFNKDMLSAFNQDVHSRILSTRDMLTMYKKDLVRVEAAHDSLIEVIRKGNLDALQRQGWDSITYMKNNVQNVDTLKNNTIGIGNYLKELEAYNSDYSSNSKKIIINNVRGTGLIDNIKNIYTSKVINTNNIKILRSFYDSMVLIDKFYDESVSTYRKHYNIDINKVITIKVLVIDII